MKPFNMKRWSAVHHLPIKKKTQQNAMRVRLFFALLLPSLHERKKNTKWLEQRNINDHLNIFGILIYTHIFHQKQL